jgi:hypothetical protein
MRNALRLFLPISIAVGVALVLVGCIYIPGNYQRIDGKPRPETLIGQEGSTKQIWVGKATRADVERVLGAPDVPARPGAPFVVYSYRITTGYNLFLCWAMSFSNEDRRFLRLDFDEQGILSGYKVYKDAPPTSWGF